MYDKEEEKLNDLKNKYEHMKVPDEEINKAILAGFQQAKRDFSEKDGKNQKTMNRWKVGLALVAIIFLTLFTSIKISPTFANYIATLPGMEKIVDLIQGDKGLLKAIEHDHFQEMNLSYKGDGVEITLDGAIADEYGLILFYTIQTDERQRDVYLENVNIEPMDGGNINVLTSSIQYNPLSWDETKEFSGAIEYFFQDPITARNMRLDFEMKGTTFLEKGSFVFHIKEDLPKMKTYTLNKTVSIEGQKMIIQEVKLTPLRATVVIKEDPRNTKKLLEFQDIRLVDENGEPWGKIMNGFTANGISETEKAYYLQSNYFSEPKELYLVFNKIQALDKDKTAVVIDTEKEVILSQPEGNKFKDLKIIGREISFKFYTEEDFPYMPFSSVIDGEGNLVEIKSSYGGSYTEEGYQRVGVELDRLKELQNPISLTLSFFPEWIEGEGKVRIK